MTCHFLVFPNSRPAVDCTAYVGQYSRRMVENPENTNVALRMSQAIALLHRYGNYPTQASRPTIPTLAASPISTIEHSLLIT